MSKFIKRHPICAGWWITIPGVCDHWYVDPVGILRDIREVFRPSLERRMERLDRRYRRAQWLHNTWSQVQRRIRQLTHRN